MPCPQLSVEEEDLFCMHGWKVGSVRCLEEIV
jgi:hypothetical protein